MACTRNDLEPPLKKPRAASDSQNGSESHPEAVCSLSDLSAKISVDQTSPEIPEAVALEDPEHEGVVPPSDQSPAQLQGKHEAYYSANFKAVLNTVLSDSPESHVISGDAAELVQIFMGLPEPQQQLYVRLFLRKHYWLRVSKLSYGKIASDLQPVLKGLVNEGFLLNEESLTDPSEVLNLLQLSELKGLCKELNLPSSVVGAQKAKIVESLFKHCRQHRPLFGTASFLDTVTKKAKRVLGACVRLSERPVEVFSKIMLLFSLTNSWMSGEDEGSFSQIIYRMLQVNVGRLVFPDYETSVTQPLFTTEEEFERYYTAARDEQQLVIAIEDKEISVVEEITKRSQGMLMEELQRFKKENDVPPPKTTSSSELASVSDSQDNGCDQEAKRDAASTPLPPYLLRFTSGWMCARTLTHCVEFLEKQGRYEEANDMLECLLSQEVYRTSVRGKWWERLALNLDHHLRMTEKCLETIQRAIGDPYLRPASRFSLLQRAHKLCQSSSNSMQTSGRRGSTSRRQGNRRTSNSKRRPSSVYKLSDFPQMNLVQAPEIYIIGKQYHTDSKTIYIASSTNSSLSRALVQVEGYAIYHYSNVEGWPCALHAEGDTFSAMFSLLMWDVIFASGVADVFRAPYQTAPLDLFSDHFYSNRKSKVDTRLGWVKAASVEDITKYVENAWNTHYGKSCAGMNWELFPSVEDAKNLAMCMGGELLSHICEEFGKDYSHAGSGLPDLTLWNPSRKTCKFVEVKGPGDRLSSKQIVWLSRLIQWGCAAEVCRVKATTN